MDLYTKEAASVTYDNLIAGETHPVDVKSVTLKAAQGVLKRGTVLGKVNKAIGAPAADAGNTGNGTVTAVSLGAGAKVGTYTLTCIGGTYTKSAEAAAWAGNAADTGALTMKDPGPIGNDVKEGVYKVLCIEPGSNAGKFSVTDPDGILVGLATAGVAFTSDHINFTIADGATDFSAGEGFDVTVTFTGAVPGNGGLFSVVDPDGASLVNATVGTPYNGAINFTINDGTADFAVEDKFTIAVAAVADLAVPADSTKYDGRQDADCILTDDVDTGSAGATDNVVATAYSSGLFNRKALFFGGTDVVANHEARLRELGIFLKDNIPC